jgi:hypothetical protein
MGLTVSYAGLIGMIGPIPRLASHGLKILQEDEG